VIVVRVRIKVGDTRGRSATMAEKRNEAKEVFDVGAFCETLDEYVKKKWNEIFEKAKETQQSVLRKLENRLKEWEKTGPPTFENAILSDEGRFHFFRIDEVIPKGMKKTFRNFEEMTFVVGYFIDRKKFRSLDAEIIVTQDDTTEDVRRKINEQYQKFLKRYEEAQDPTTFIDVEEMATLARLVAAKKEIC